MSSVEKESADAVPVVVEQGSSLWKDAWSRMRKNQLAMASFLFVVLIVFLCFVVAWFCPNPDTIDLENKFATPSAAHFLGTDQLGRDILARTLYGGQISLLVGFVATAVALCIGIVYGAISGFVGGRTDAVMMRTVDTLFAIPFLVIVIVLQVVIADRTAEMAGWIVEHWGWNKKLTDRMANIVPLFIALGAFGWLTLGRIVRAQVLSLREQEFVEAARSLGLSQARILFRHIIPNTLGPTVVYATLTVPGFIMYEATLSYLGLGVEAPNSSWGILIRDGANFLETQPMLLIIPGLFFSLTLFALNFLGDGLRDALDVRASKD
ncbi:MAG: oligopeptide transport system permease protein [Verrucomicrobiales bacterium]|jgi:oligopeptide transport system permease protein